jgi:hypothetical protein
VSLKIWDVRTGGTFETLKYDHAVTALQFDTRKVIAATGENGVKVDFLTVSEYCYILTLFIRRSTIARVCNIRLFLQTAIRNPSSAYDIWTGISFRADATLR